MGEAQKLPYEQQLRFAREQYEAGEDFTVAVEEEFAVLDPETLGLTNRFEELKAAAAGTDLEEHLVGVNGPDRAIAVCGALRSYLPELLALSASSPFLEDTYTYLHSARTQIFTRMFPRCGVPDAFAGWAEYEDYVRKLYETGSIDEHTQIWWSVRAHLAFPTVEIRICDGQPDLGEAQSLAAFAYALAPRLARAHDEGEPLPAHPHRWIEENFWRAIRYGLAGELIDLDTFEVRPTRTALERLVAWGLPGAEGLGCAAYLACPAAN